MSELKACPFCGAEAHIKYSWLGNECVAIGCGGNKGCPAANDEQDEQGGFSCEFDNVDDATKNWNTRPLEDALRARAEAAEARVENLEKALKFLDEIFLIWKHYGTISEGEEELAKIVRATLRGEEVEK